MKETIRHYNGNDFVIVDLPGTYSLTAYSLEEVVTRNFIVNDKPDMVIDILDTSNLERNLYLTVQLLELERPTILALNMIDMADASGLKIDYAKLADRLGGIPVVRTNGVGNKGMDALLSNILQSSDKQEKSNFKLNYGTDVENAIQKLEPLLILTTYPKDIEYSKDYDTLLVLKKWLSVRWVLFIVLATTVKMLTV